MGFPSGERRYTSESPSLEIFRKGRSYAYIFDEHRM